MVFSKIFGYERPKWMIELEYEDSYSFGFYFSHERFKFEDDLRKFQRDNNVLSIAIYDINYCCPIEKK